MAQVSLDFVCIAKYEVNWPSAAFISRYSWPGVDVSPFATAFMLTFAYLVLHAVPAYTADVGWSAKLNIRRSKMKTHPILCDHIIWTTYTDWSMQAPQSFTVLK